MIIKAYNNYKKLTLNLNKQRYIVIGHSRICEHMSTVKYKNYKIYRSQKSIRKILILNEKFKKKYNFMI